MLIRLVCCAVFLATLTQCNRRDTETSQARNYHAEPEVSTPPLSKQQFEEELRTYKQTPAGRKSEKLVALLRKISRSVENPEENGAQLRMLFQQFQAGFEQLNAMELSRNERGEIREYLHASIHHSVGQIRAGLASNPLSEQSGQVNVELALLQEYMMQF